METDLEQMIRNADILFEAAIKRLENKEDNDNIENEENRRINQVVSMISDTVVNKLDNEKTLKNNNTELEEIEKKEIIDRLSKEKDILINTCINIYGIENVDFDWNIGIVKDKDNNFIYDELSYLEIKILFPYIKIRNSSNQEHDITDILVSISFLINHELKWIFDRFQGTRLSCTSFEYYSQYFHSHLPINNYNTACFNNFCLGTSFLRTDFSEFNLKGFSNNESDIIKWEAIVFGIKSYLEWESLEGTPYIKLTNVTNRVINNQESTFYRYENNIKLIIMMIKQILVPKDFKFRILNQEYINFIKISNREEMEGFMIKIIKLILLNNEPAFEINGRRISRSKGSIIVNNIDIPIFKSILDSTEDHKKMLLDLFIVKRNASDEDIYEYNNAVINNKIIPSTINFKGVNRDIIINDFEINIENEEKKKMFLSKFFYNIFEHEITYKLERSFINNKVQQFTNNKYNGQYNQKIRNAREKRYNARNRSRDIINNASGIIR